MAVNTVYSVITIIWVIVFILVLGGIGLGIYYLKNGIDQSKPLGFVFLIGTVVVIIITVLTSTLYLNSQTFQRNYREAVTNYETTSVYREMKVVSRSGDIIYETEGAYDIEYKEGRLRWIDEDGYVQLIYLGDSATVVVNEIKPPQEGNND